MTPIPGCQQMGQRAISGAAKSQNPSKPTNISPTMGSLSIKHALFRRCGGIYGHRGIFYTDLHRGGLADPGTHAHLGAKKRVNRGVCSGQIDKPIKINWHITHWGVLGMKPALFRRWGGIYVPGVDFLTRFYTVTSCRAPRQSPRGHLLGDRGFDQGHGK